MNKRKIQIIFTIIYITIFPFYKFLLGFAKCFGDRIEQIYYNVLEFIVLTIIIFITTVIICEIIDRKE